MERTIRKELVAGNHQRAFGGALMADLLDAAAKLGRPQGEAHSLHGHFLHPGRAGEVAEFAATTLRRSANFATIEARVHQDERLIAVAVVSFGRRRASRAHGALATTPALQPETAPLASGGPIPAAEAPLRAAYELRDAGAGKAVDRGPDGRPVFQFWVRRREPSHETRASTADLVWISDFFLTHVADVEHADSPGLRRAASLDHAMWFHRPADPTDWLLYELSSPAYEDSLALTTGRFFTRDGRLVASVAQQSLLQRTDAQRTDQG